MRQHSITTQPPTVNDLKELATRMASTVQEIRHAISLSFKSEASTGSLHGQLEGFRQVLLPDLTAEQFADMYAQAICYGLFAARVHAQPSKHFTRELAAYDIPKTSSFLRKMFNYIADPDLDEQVAWAVDDLAAVLNHTDIEAILDDFGKHTRQEDPVVHFYETFLAAYDPKMREARGVYYTPEPVVSYIVRSVDYLLKKDFGLPDGLADATKITTKSSDGSSTIETHKVLILDPATGTGTFLHSVIDTIHETFRGNKDMWSSYVSQHLLPRIFGFELLIAPYAVAHMKLGLQLKEMGYDFQGSERLGVYLTNTLEEDFGEGNRLPFVEWLVEEATAAENIRQEAPVMVILGNPPYSGHSANKGKWITDLLHSKGNSYFEVDGQSLGERNPKWLNDDYVKFIRFAQWRIERAGYGILAFTTNHGYIDNPTFRGMRQSLLESFDDIYILDLHGNSKKKERSPDGSKDENVFDIQQGVAIGIFVKHKGHNRSSSQAIIHHAHLWGPRETYDKAGPERQLTGGKYHWLARNAVSTTEWTTVHSKPPFYLFKPQDTLLHEEYEQGTKLTDILSVSSVGIVTARDALTIHMHLDDVWKTVLDFISVSSEEAGAKYDLGKDAIDWKVTAAQQDLKTSGPSKSHLTAILYRPFDTRYTYYTGNSRGFHCRPRGEIMHHVLDKKNLGLVTTRSIEIGRGWEHIFCTSNLIQHHTVSLKEVNYLFPLYLYPDPNKHALFDTNHPSNTPSGRCPNLAPAFIADITNKLNRQFLPEGKGNLQEHFGPEDILHYMYAVFHSPTYRTRYAEFLKIDFPRLPLTSDADLFRGLCKRGECLVRLHLIEQFGRALPTYSGEGNNTVEKVDYRASQDQAGRVYINKTQYFDGIPSEVWNFCIGGYQICQKWLKDRKEWVLSYEDIKHYQRIVAALAETINLMGQIDETIEEHGGWPIR